jgi:hypothetical protein
MSLRKTIEVVTQLAEKRAIKSYAIAGAVAALNYIEPMLTEDLDILISIDGFEKRPSGLLLLDPIEKALAGLGYTERSDVGYKIGGWPVQFLPVASALDEEGLEQAIDENFAQKGEEPLLARVLRAEHVVAMGLNVGRLKDLARIEAFLKQDAIDLKRLKSVIKRHNLEAKWSEFCIKAGIKNPLIGIE